MINIDSRLFQKLTDSEYYLLSVLAEYGKTSCPDNDVLMKRTNWGIQKLQATKKYLVGKGFLEIKPRTDKEKGGKISNEYIIKTNLISKFNGKKNNENQVIENRIIELQLLENRIVENQIDDNQLIEKQTDLYLLKEPFIKNIKELLKEKESIKSTLTQKDFEIEALKAKIAELEKPFVPPHATDIKQAAWKSQIEESWKVELKSLPVFQELSIENQESILEFCNYKQECLNSEEGQKDKKKQIASSTAKQILKTFTNFLKDYKDELVRESICYAIQSSHSNFNPIWLLNSKNDKQSQKTENKEPEPEQLETYLLKHHQQKEVEYFKKEGKFEKWEKELEENRQRLIDMAKGYKNEKITPLLLFEMFYLPLSYALNGSSPTRKQEAFERLYAKQSQYNQDKGDFRQIIKQEYEKQKA